MEELNQIDNEKLLDHIMEELLKFEGIFRDAIHMAEIKETPEVKPWIQGMKLLYKNYLRLFKSIGLEKIEPEIGTNLNPNIHQVIDTRIFKELPPDKIAEIISPGFCFQKKTLRPAEVIISTNIEENQQMNQNIEKISEKN